jgi:hypothetical protein
MAATMWEGGQRLVCVSICGSPLLYNFISNFYKLQKKLYTWTCLWPVFSCGVNFLQLAKIKNKNLVLLIQTFRGFLWKKCTKITKIWGKNVWIHHIQTSCFLFVVRFCHLLTQKKNLGPVTSTGCFRGEIPQIHHISRKRSLNPNI